MTEDLPLDLPAKATLATIKAALRAEHPPEPWALFFELRVGTGFGSRGNVQELERRIDAYALHLWPSASHRRVAYEVKVSRSDFLRELKQPWKRRAALRFSNEFWFAVAEGVARAPELPPEAGLLEVAADGKTTIVRPAPWRESLPPTWAFYAAMARRAQGKTKAAPEEQTPC